MKKAIKINLSGVIFHIDEDAYEKLKKYLDAIGRHFSDKEEGEEILHDIESRIAEIFQEKKDREEVIDFHLVNEVINIMGDPEDIVDSGEKTASGKEFSKSGSPGSRTTRRLYRDPENSVFGGVCGGLGAYFNVDPLIFRILFLVFFFVGGASILVYIILWIVLPKAVTAAQKLEMRGEPVNVSNIEKKVREEYESAKENVRAAANSETVKKTKEATRNFFSEAGKVLLVIVKVVLIIIGTGFVLAGIGIIIGLISGTFLGLQIFPFSNYHFSMGELLTPFSDPVSITLLIISLTLLFLIPVFAMIYGLIRLIFAIRTRNRGLTIGTTLLWLVALFMTIGILAMETGNYSKMGRSDTIHELSMTGDTFVVTIDEMQEKEFEKEIEFDLDLQTEWYITEDLDRIYGLAELDIEPSDDSQIRLKIDKRSKGKSDDDADENAANLNYSFRTSGNMLILDPYFFLESDDKWRFPRVNVTLYLPEGKVVRLDKSTREMLENIYNINHISDWRMGGKTWIMTDDGLKLVEE